MTADLIEVDELAAEAQRLVDARVLTWSDAARNLGWLKRDRSRDYERCKADTQRVRRALGLISHTTRRANGEYVAELRKRIDYGRALELAGAFGIDPVDVGL